MMKKIGAIGDIIVFFVLLYFIASYISPALDWGAKQTGLAHEIIFILLLLIPIIFLVEVGLKGIFLHAALTPLKFIPTDAETCTYLNQDALRRYTSDLKNMGFIHLTDYTIQDGTGTARLFAHTEYFCFAEVGQQDGMPAAFCSVSSLLRNQWAMGITNAPANPLQAAISFAFLRTPFVLSKGEEGASVKVIFQDLLDWRAKVCKDVGVLPKQEMNAEVYFAFERRKRMSQRKRMICRSMIWSLLELKWFMMHPKSEWLGDYRKFTKTRS